MTRIKGNAQLDSGTVAVEKPRDGVEKHSQVSIVWSQTTATNPREAVEMVKFPGNGRRRKGEH